MAWISVDGKPWCEFVPGSRVELLRIAREMEGGLIACADTNMGAHESAVRLRRCLEPNRLVEVHEGVCPTVKRG